MSQKYNLVKAHILLQCSDPNHKDMCAKLRDALLENFNEVLEAGTVAPIEGSTDFCVSGIAKINSKKYDKFKAALRSLKANPKTNSTVKDVKVYLESK